MGEIKIMIVPGKIARVEITEGMTVLAACKAAEHQVPDVAWTELAKSRDVRVQNKRFSNTAETPEGFFGTIKDTPLKDGDVILILTKIKGNSSAAGIGTLTCLINNQEYALENPDTVGNVITNVAGFEMAQIRAISINDEEVHPDQLVGMNDTIRVTFFSEDEDLGKDCDEITVTIDGHSVTGKPAHIRRLIA